MIKLSKKQLRKFINETLGENETETTIKLPPGVEACSCDEALFLRARIAELEEEIERLEHDARNRRFI